MLVSQAQVRRELLTRGLVSRGDLPETLRQMRELEDDRKTLGLAPSSYAPGVAASLALARSYSIPGRTADSSIPWAMPLRSAEPWLISLHSLAFQTIQVMNEGTSVDLQTSSWKNGRETGLCKKPSSGLSVGSALVMMAR